MPQLQERNPIIETDTHSIRLVEVDFGGSHQWLAESQKVVASYLNNGYEIQSVQKIGDLDKYDLALAKPKKSKR